MRAQFIIFLLIATPGLAADLKPETIARWDEYIKAVDARNQQNLASGSSFFSFDAVPGQAAKLREGNMIVSPAGQHILDAQPIIMREYMPVEMAHVLNRSKRLASQMRQDMENAVKAAQTSTPPPAKPR